MAFITGGGSCLDAFLFLLFMTLGALLVHYLLLFKLAFGFQILNATNAEPVVDGLLYHHLYQDTIHAPVLSPAAHVRKKVDSTTALVNN